MSTRGWMYFVILMIIMAYQQARNINFGNSFYKNKFIIDITNNLYKHHQLLVDEIKTNFIIQNFIFFLHVFM